MATQTIMLFNSMKLLKKSKKLKVAAIAIVGCALIKTAWATCLYAGGDKLIDGTDNTDVFNRRKFLKQSITIQNDEYPEKQVLLPPRFQGEWALLSCSMYSMALCNLAFSHPEMQEDCAKEISILADRCMTPAYRRFDIDAWNEDPLATLDSDNGHAWYLGHLNLMLTCYRLAGGDTKYDALTHKISAALAHRVESDAAMLVQTYPDERYIPDNSVVLASLKNHDIAFGTDYYKLIERWGEFANKRLTRPDTNTFVFRTSEGAKLRSRSRSSGAAFALMYLFHADKNLFDDHYQRLKTAFSQTYLPSISLAGTTFPGAGALKENSDGSSSGDIDSGPVIFGLSPGGTGFGIGCAKAAGDRELLSKMLVTAELAGGSIDVNGQRHYLLAPTVGEAILLAGKTATAWDGRYLAPVRTALIPAK